MKASNRTKKLQSRIKDWEDIRASEMLTPKVKMVNKSAFTKPGSNKK